MSKGLLRGIPLFMVAIFLALIVSPSVVAQQSVFIIETGFSPSQLTINVGDSVLWFNYDVAGSHTTTSDKPVGHPDYWDRTLNYFEFYTHSFIHAGTFNYHDSIGGFTATIVVKGPAPLLEAPRMVNGQFLFDASGLTVGKTNVLGASTNLTQWTAIQTNVATSSLMTLTNGVSSGRTFFRLQETR